MADASYNNNYYDNTGMGYGDISGITRRKGMTTSIISAFPQNAMGAPGTKGSGKQGTLFGGVLTILAIMIGTGVIGIPYAVYKLSISVGLALLFTYIILAMLSLDLLYESSRLTGCKSLSEIGFYCLGKASVYIINLVVFAKSAGMPIIYFILTGTCCSNIASKIEGCPEFMTHNYPWVLLAAALLLYFALKKDVTDLKPISLFLFLGILIFIIILTYHMIAEQKNWNEDKHHSGYYTPFNEKKHPIRLVYCAETVLVGVCFSTVFFPVLNNLKDNTKSGIMKTSFVGLLIAVSIYTICIFVSIYAFGHNVHSDILKNVGENKGWETYLLGGLFAIVGALHIPLIFYVGKEAMLIIIFTLFYTIDEKEDENGDVSHITVSQNLGAGARSRLVEDRNDISGNLPTRSELNKTTRSVLKKTSVLPNIDVSITRQVLALNPSTSMLRKDGNKGYEQDLKAQDIHKEPSHKDMALWIYLTVTLSVYGVDVALACILDDVSIVFGFIGAFSISMLFFILPGLFYIRATQLSAEGGQAWRKIVSYTYILLGFGLMFGGVASVIVKLIEDGKDDAKPEDVD